ncbi:MAG: sulfurtransferase [Pseudomonadota bacterium]
MSPIISAAQLINSQNSGQPLVIVDCRASLTDIGAGLRRYHEGHIRGAVYASIDQDLSGEITSSTGRHPLPPLEEFVAFLREIGVCNDSTMVVYDDMGGAMAARLWWMMTALGHTRIQVLDGGLQSYEAMGGEITAGQERNPPGDFDADGVWSVVTTHQIATDPQLSVVDARAEERFSGEVEPIDGKAGHIPGAYNLPFGGNLDAHGRFKSPEEIRLRFEAQGLNPNKRHTAMCGSGITACHLLLARAVAGLTPWDLYAGSWSEWISDPTRPVETGP